MIKKEKKKAKKKNIKEIINKLLIQIYIPSFKSFFTILILTIFYYAVIFILKIKFGTYVNGILFISKVNSFIDARFSVPNMIAIHAGIATIIFALIIFIAESLRGEETKDRIRVLLRESYLFPLVIFAILIFFALIITGKSIWHILPIFVTGILAINSLSKIILIFLNRYRFLNKRIEVFKERIKHSINLAIDERIGKSIVISRLNKNDIRLDYNPILDTDNSDYYIFKSHDKGTIINIYMDRLKKFADLIDNEARKNNFTFFISESRSSVETAGSINIGETSESKQETLILNRNRYLLKGFNDYVDEESNILFCIDKRLIKNERILNEIRHLSKNIFVIEEHDKYSDEMRYELYGVKDQFITAIRDKKLGVIDGVFNKIYLALAESFLESMQKIGIVYPSKLTREERGSLFSGWDEIKWLSEDYSDIFEFALQTEDKGIIISVCYLPFAIVRRSVKSNDHYLFQEFINYSYLMYFFAQEKEGKLKGLLIERSWRYLKEIAQYDIQFRMNRENIEKDELISLKDFAVYVFIILQKILKEAFDIEDFQSFEKLTNVCQELFKRFKPSESSQNSNMLRWELENSDLEIHEKNTLNDLLKLQTLKEGCEEEIYLRKMQMFFGLSSWIMDIMIKGKLFDELSKFFNIIHNLFPNDLVKLTNLFIKTNHYDVEHFWGWEWWELREEEDGITHIDILNKILRFYCIKSLLLIQHKSDQDIENIQLPFCREFDVLLDNEGKLIKYLDNIAISPEMYSPILTVEALAKIGKLKKIFQDLKKKYDEDERVKIRNAKISQQRVDRFKSDVINGFYKSIILRNVVKHYKLFQKDLRKNFKAHTNKFGYSNIDKKEPFIEPWHTDLLDFGAVYGDNLAKSEDTYIMNTIKRKCTTVAKNQFDQTLGNISDISEVLIFSSNVNIYTFFEESSRFVPKWSPNCDQINIKGFDGIYIYKGYKIPIFNIYISNNDEQILIVNKTKLGVFIQYSPLNEGDLLSLQSDNFHLDVKSFSEDGDLVEKFINDQPNWLSKVGNNREQREFLKEHVLIHVFERFEFNLHKNFIGYVFG